MMMALAASHDLPCVLVPGGVTLLPVEGDDAGRVQTIGVRFVHGELSLEEASELGCRACASPGGGCQFLGTAATSQVVGEALGMSLGHSALAPSGHPIWLDMARRSARALDGARAARRHDEGHPDRRGDPQRDGDARRVRRIDEPHPAPAGDRACGRTPPADRARLDRRQPPRAAHRRRPAQRTAPSSDDSGVSGRRRARGHAAPSTRRPARHARADGERRHARRAARRVGGVRAPRTASRRSSRRATASIQTT